jgi:hypothetical protein
MLAMNSIAVKTRFALSPTGLLHLGNVRAALTVAGHSSGMDKLWRLLGDVRVRRRFTAVEALCNA